MKNPAFQALELYEKHPQMSWQKDWAAHAAGGYVICTPEVYLMARPICKDWPAHMIATPELTAKRESADCWFIWLLCGSLKEAVKHIPYPLPWFGFSQRGEPARFVESEKVLAKLR